MPVPLTYPGVYIEEVPSGVRTIVGVSTSTTAFVGRARKGPSNKATVINSFAEYDRIFGGLWTESRMSFAVHQYFLNGGSVAVIVRVSSVTVGNTEFSLGNLVLEASSPGSWADDLEITGDFLTSDPSDTNLFNLVVNDPGSGDIETIRNVSVDLSSKRFVQKVLEQESKLVRLISPVPPQLTLTAGAVASVSTPGDDGGSISDIDLIGSSVNKTGIYALQDADIFNLLCLPPLEEGIDVPLPSWGDAAAFCAQQRAILLVDPPAPSSALSSVDDTPFMGPIANQLGSNKKNAALYFPRFLAANPLKNNLPEEFAPCGAIAGIIARTDSQRGVWKAPAGQEAGFNGVSSLTYKLTDGENGQLNPKAINCLRNFPTIGSVVWGARTLDGADALASEWKYLSVRRTALFIEESLFRGTQWVVFEPNDEPLWAQIRLNLGAFMHTLFRQGAFQGRTPREAYFVKCDKDTTTQNDINLGIVNILVGFAPLKPAEFVVIKLQQMAGQIES